MEEDEKEARALVVDTNVLISAMMRSEGITRIAFLFLANDPSNRMLCPRIVTEEIERNYAEIARRAHAPPKLIRAGLDELLTRMTMVDESEFSAWMAGSRTLVNDENDTSFAALAVKSSPSVIVTYDKAGYREEELRKSGVLVLTPVEALKHTGVELSDIDIRRRRKGDAIAVIARILALVGIKKKHDAK